jgi:hypothetical protein
MDEEDRVYYVNPDDVWKQRDDGTWYQPLVELIEEERKMAEAKLPETHYTIEDLIALWDRIRVRAWTAGDAVIQKTYKAMLLIAEEIDPKEKPEKAEKTTAHH